MISADLVVVVVVEYRLSFCVCPPFPIIHHDCWIVLCLLMVRFSQINFWQLMTVITTVVADGIIAADRVRTSEHCDHVVWIKSI